MKANAKLAIIIPCYRVKKHILPLLKKAEKYADVLICIDDCCPENSGKYIEENFQSEKINIIWHEKNQGVGAAMISGYEEALRQNTDIAIKLDGDGQMNPELIPKLCKPILCEQADYTKGNRFYSYKHIKSMPIVRRLGNLALSFFTKLSSGYWQIFDPANGFTAISCEILKQFDFQTLEKRYFFESDMLFRLNTLRAVVRDIPQHAQYAEEESNLSVLRSLPEFFIKNTVRACKRVIYNYFIRDFSIASIELVSGMIFFVCGIIFGFTKWHASNLQHHNTPTGTIMIAALLILMGFQLLMSFINYDIKNVPRDPIHPFL